MKKNWKILTLGEVIKLEYGKPLPENKRISNGSFPIYGANGEKGRTNTYYHNKKTVIIGRKGSAGEINLSEEKFWPLDVTYFITFDETKYDLTFIFHLLDFLKLPKLAKGVKPGINRNEVYSLVVQIPTLFEQQKIGITLNETFNAITTAKINIGQNLRNAKGLFESYLQNVFVNKDKDWEENKLGELGTITSSKRIYKSEYVKNGIPFYRTKEIKELSNEKEITLELFISKEKYYEIKKVFGVPQINDLLMSAVGTIGEIMVIEDEKEFYFKDGNIVWFKEFKCLDTNYLKYALTAFVEKIKSLAIGSAYNALTIEKLNLYKISYPKSLKEQQNIVQKLDALSIECKKLESIYQKKVIALDELKKSILQKAFSGQLS
jgi:type I restriction enzyme S subunit